MEGNVTDSVKYIATAASAADPPAANTSRPISVARGSSDAIPWKAWIWADWTSLRLCLVVLLLFCAVALAGSEVVSHEPNNSVSLHAPTNNNAHKESAWVQ